MTDQQKLDSHITRSLVMALANRLRDFNWGSELPYAESRKVQSISKSILKADTKLLEQLNSNFDPNNKEDMDLKSDQFTGLQIQQIVIENAIELLCSGDDEKIFKLMQLLNVDVFHKQY